MGLKKSKGTVADVLGKKVPEVLGPASSVETTIIKPIENEVTLDKRETSIDRTQRIKTLPKIEQKTKTKQNLKVGEMHVLQISLPVPAPKISKIFDQIADLEGQKKAMSVVLTRALDSYLELDAAQRKSLSVPDYKTGVMEVKTTRRMNKGLYEELAGEVDPLGIHASLKIANSIARSALNIYFATQK